jgi:murein L,D-transpeptidase YafK
MNRRSFSTAALSLALASGLGGCLTTPAHLTPLSDEALELMALKGLQKGAAMYVRIFKQEEELEIWLQNSAGFYTHFETYAICKWSGELGPKVAEGDRQAPEGFYVVTAGQMNPFSDYHLAFNIGYPNEYDLAHERTGTHLMVHGGCRSAGCYAVTDHQVEEIFALARESFLAGQDRFPVHAFPFRLTAENLAQHADSPWHDFWSNLKEGYDFFEANRLTPVVGVADKRYVFFETEEAVPEAFVIAAGDSDPDQPQLISGWGN